MGEPVPELIRRALRLVRERQPLLYAEAAEHLEGLSVSIAIEEPLTLCGARGQIQETKLAGRADIRLSAARSAVRALIAGRKTLNESLRSGEIEMAGTIGALGRGLRAFECAVAGLLRIEEAGEVGRELGD